MEITYVLRHGRTELGARYIANGDPALPVYLDTAGVAQCQQLAAARWMPTIVTCVLPREMKKYEDPIFEFRVRDIAAADRVSARLPTDLSGVLVDAVREGGFAALGHLADGDMLLTIDGDAMPDVEAVQKKMASITTAKPKSVVFKVRRGIRTFFVELETDWR